MKREDSLLNFINKSGVDVQSVTLLQQDASQRRYYRGSILQNTYIIMDCPPDYMLLDSFINTTYFLTEKGFSVPIIYAEDRVNGFLLLEDFGDSSVNNILRDSKKKEDEIYFLAIDNLITLSKEKPPTNIPSHSKEELQKGFKIYDEFYLKGGDSNFVKKTSLLLDKLDYSRNYISLRDFHADNLFWLEGRDSINKIGLLDYQDMSNGFLAYDLVSLLQDARRCISQEKRELYYNYFIENIINIDKDKFALEYKILSLQRNMRIVGLFTKFAFEGNKKYLQYLDVVFSYLGDSLSIDSLLDS